MTLSTLTFFGGDIPDPSDGTPGLWNRRFSILSQNLDAVNQAGSPIASSGATGATSIWSTPSVQTYLPWSAASQIVQSTAANTFPIVTNTPVFPSITATTFTGNLVGNASTATNVAGTGLTGTILASNVVTSSLTTIGTLVGGAVPASLVTAGTFAAGNFALSGTAVLTATTFVGALTGNADTATSAAKWTTARNLAGNSVDGSATVAFANKFIVQGTVDAGLSAAQFLGALTTGIVKNTTTTGVLSIAAAASDYVAPSAYASANGLTMATNKLLGRSTAATGAAEEIAIGSGLSLSAGTLTASGSGGTVTSVGLSLPSFITVSGSPVTTIGTLTGTLATQVTKTFFAGPTSGVDAAPTFRVIAVADVPTLNQNTTGSAATLTTGRTISITGDLTYTSPSFDGSGNVTAAGTLATVNLNVGSFGSSTSIPTVTVNGKGLITAASGNAVVAPAGTLTGATLAAGVTASSLTSVGILTGLTVSGTLSHTNASPFSMTNGQVVTVANTAQTIGAATLTIPNFAGVSDTFAFLTLAQTLSAKTLSGPTLSGTVSGTPTWASNQAITLSTASQPNVTTVGALIGGSIAAGFGNINNANNSITSGVIASAPSAGVTPAIQLVRGDTTTGTQLQFKTTSTENWHIGTNSGAGVPTLVWNDAFNGDVMTLARGGNLVLSGTFNNASNSLTTGAISATTYAGSGGITLDLNTAGTPTFTALDLKNSAGTNAPRFLVQLEQAATKTASLRGSAGGALVEYARFTLDTGAVSFLSNAVTMGALTATTIGGTSITASTSFLGTILDSNAASDLLLKYNGTTKVTVGASATVFTTKTDHNAMRFSGISTLTAGSKYLVLNLSTGEVEVSALGPLT